MGRSPTTSAKPGIPAQLGNRRVAVSVRLQRLGVSARAAPNLSADQHPKVLAVAAGSTFAVDYGDIPSI